MIEGTEGTSTAHQLLEHFVRQAVVQLEMAILLGHGGEIGRAREESLRALLRTFLPPSLGVSTGFVIDALGGRSRQVDIIVHFADYHAVFLVNGIPLVPVEAVIAVIEVKSDASSTAVLRECYDNIRSVKCLNRSNEGRNSYLIDREPYHLAPEHWDTFQLQVLGGVLALESGSTDLWLNVTHAWCEEHTWTEWPNFYCGVKDFVGTYHVQHDGVQSASPDMSDAAELLAFRPSGQTPLAWAVQEVLNFVRVARRVDYLPSAYLDSGQTAEAERAVRPLPAKY